MARLKVMLAIVSVTAISACESTMETVKSIDLNTNESGNQLIAYPAEIRGAYVRTVEALKHGQQYIPKYDAKGEVIDYKPVSVTFVKAEQILCAEPPPDSTVSSSASLNASANLQLTQSLAAVTSLTNALTHSISNQSTRTTGDAANTFNSSGAYAGSTSSNNAQSRSSNVSETSNDALSLAASITRTANELAGRDNTVLLSREMFFRNCEAYANGAISRDTYGQLHRESVSQITTMLETKKAAAKAAEAQSQANKAQAEADKLKAQKTFNDAMRNSRDIWDSLSQDDSVQQMTCESELGRCAFGAEGDNRLIQCKEEYKKCEDTIGEE